MVLQALFGTAISIRLNPYPVFYPDTDASETSSWRSAFIRKKPYIFDLNSNLPFGRIAYPFTGCQSFLSATTMQKISALQKPGAFQASRCVHSMFSMGRLS